MDATIAVTYRCNSRCRMCDIWKYPTGVDEEFTPELLNKLPRLSLCNITGGEPFLRDDLDKIVRVLKKEANRIIISTNGYLTEEIVKFALRNKDVGLRISLEGLPSTNDQIRGTQDGFEHGLRTLLELDKLGLKDLGLGCTVSGENAKEMLELYQLAKAIRVDFTAAVVHNSYFFHKYNNRINNQNEVINCFEKLIRELLSTRKIKNYYRAYFNHGLINYIKGDRRLLPCEAGMTSFLLDPWGEIKPCNGRDERNGLENMGNLNQKSFAEIWAGEDAKEIRRQVRSCPKNCWMICNVASVMKKYIWRPTFWIIKNKYLR